MQYRHFQCTVQIWSSLWLDLILSSEEAMVKNLEYLSGLGTSDHIMLQFQVACYCPPTEPLVPHLNLSQGNFTLLNRLMSEVEWPTSSSLDTHAMYLFIKAKLSEHSTTCIPLAKSKLKNNIYMNHKAIRVKKQKRTLWLQYMRTRDMFDYARFRRARNKLRTLTLSLWANFESHLVTNLRTSAKGFWRYAGTRLRTKTRVEDLKAEDGTMVREDNDKANLLNHFFQSVFTVEDPVLPAAPPPLYAGPPLNNIDISTGAISFPVIIRPAAPRNRRQPVVNCSRR